MTNDPVIDEIRQVRHQISEQFGHDPARLVAYYLELQKQHADRLIGDVKKQQSTDTSAA